VLREHFPLQLQAQIRNRNCESKHLVSEKVSDNDALCQLELGLQADLDIYPQLEPVCVYAQADNEAFKLSGYTRDRS